MVASRIPHGEPDREQPVGRDERFRVIEPPHETVDGGPDIAPLIVFREVASDHEIGEGAEGDEILGEQMARRREVDGPDMLGELAKPVFDGVEILWNGLLGAEVHRVTLWVESNTVS